MSRFIVFYSQLAKKNVGRLLKICCIIWANQLGMLTQFSDLESLKFAFVFIDIIVAKAYTFDEWRAKKIAEALPKDSKEGQNESVGP